MKIIVRIDISAPVAHALTLQPIVTAFHKAICEMTSIGVEDAFVDYNTHASNPKRFEANWDRRVKESA